MSSRHVSGRKGKEQSYRQLSNVELEAPRPPPPLASICLVFETEASTISAANNHRQQIVDKLRASDLLVTENVLADRKEAFVLISASEKRLQQVADLMGLKLRLLLRDMDSGQLEKNEGAWTPFQQHLSGLYEHSSEGGLFSSNQQLRILEYILADEDERAMGPQLVAKEKIELGNSALDQLVKNKVIKTFFHMHNALRRDDLVKRWVFDWTGRQPIEDIREYFGEKIALYFVWLGFYTSMLWIPAICGTFLIISQMISYSLTGSMDNPWVPLYCCFMSVWSIVLSVGWKRLEKSYQYEWDTLEFEETEEERKEFIQSEHTTARLIAYKGTYERVADPLWRKLALGLSVAVVVSFIAVVIFVVASIALMRFKLLRILEPRGLSWIAKAVGGVSQALSIMLFNRIYQEVLTRLTNFENWKTGTQYEDAAIAKDFSFKIVNAYFACFFVAFVQNNIKVFGEDMHCPEWNCMSELTMTLATIFMVQLTVQQVLELGLPVGKQLWKRLTTGREEGLRRASAMLGDERVGEEGGLSEEAAQSLLPEYPGVIDDYAEMIIQLGYVNLFAAAFPFMAALALINNLIEIRVDAYKLLKLTKRPPHQCAQDIGMWQGMMEVLTTCSIMTNCALVGFVSHGLLFYFPDMTSNERVWISILCEHCLLLFKAVLETQLQDAPDEAREAHERRVFIRDKVLAEVQGFRPGAARPYYDSDDDAR